MVGTAESTLSPLIPETVALRPSRAPSVVVAGAAPLVFRRSPPGGGDETHHGEEQEQDGDWGTHERRDSRPARRN